MDTRYFWQDLVDHNVERPEISQTMIDEANRTLGVTLPNDLINVLRQQNGGTPRRRAFFPQSPYREKLPSWIGNHIVIDSIQTLDAIRLQLQSNSPEGMVFIGWERYTTGQICLDYRTCGPHGNPAVACYAWSMSSDPVLLAPCIGFVFERLVIDELNDCYGIQTSEFERAWHQIARKCDLISYPVKHFGGEIDPDFPDGFATIAGSHKTWKGKDPDEQALFRLTPNRDSGNAIGFPEQSKDLLVLRVNIDPIHRGKLQAALSELPYDVTVLRLVDWEIWKKN
jgi:hypothetical protein